MDFITSLVDQVLFYHVLKDVLGSKVKDFYWFEVHNLWYRVVSIYDENVEVHFLFAVKVVILARLSSQVRKPCTNIDADMPFVKAKIAECIVVDESNEYFVIIWISLLDFALVVIGIILLVIMSFMIFMTVFLFFLVPIVYERLWAELIQIYLDANLVEPKVGGQTWVLRIENLANWLPLVEGLHLLYSLLRFEYLVDYVLSKVPDCHDSYLVILKLIQVMFIIFIFYLAVLVPFFFFLFGLKNDVAV